MICLTIVGVAQKLQTETSFGNSIIEILLIIMVAFFLIQLVKSYKELKWIRRKREIIEDEIRHNEMAMDRINALLNQLKE